MTRLLKKKSMHKPCSLISLSLVLFACSGGGGGGGGGGSAGNVSISPTMLLHEKMQVLGMVIDHAIVDDRDGISGAEFRELTNRIYTEFDDAFDFIVFVSNFNGSTGVPVPASLTYSGSHITVSNDVAGIGVPMFSNSGIYGSTNRLKSVIHLSSHGTIRGGPSLHEIMHHWANNSGIVSSSSSHWQFAGIGKSMGGQLGGFAADSLLPLGGNRYQANNGRAGWDNFGTNANGGNGLPYSDLELYLMGLKSVSATVAKLPEITHFTDAAWQNSGDGIFTSNIGPQSASFASYQSDLGGARNPNSTNSQDTFRILTVLIDTSMPNNSDLASIDTEVTELSFSGNAGNFSVNFFEATEGLGTLDMSNIDQDLK